MAGRSLRHCKVLLNEIIQRQVIILARSRDACSPKQSVVTFEPSLTAAASLTNLSACLYPTDVTSGGRDSGCIVTHST